jgi:hypothetical protein
MGAILPLPPELSAFLNREAPQALLVRGPPGTGKTTLAFALLQSYPGARFYVSSRVRRPELEQSFPWIGGSPANGGNGVRVIDFAEPGEPPTAALHAIASASKLLADPAGREALRSLLLPSALIDAWSQSTPGRPSMIVIDSWDAVVERHLGLAESEGAKPPGRAELERIALAQLSRDPVFLVLVVEDRNAEQLEYLVNGVVTTDRRTTHDRLERWLTLDKLRGTRIASPAYPFTLEAARFQCAARLDARHEIRLGPADAEPDRMPGTIWPGSVDFATHFGRLRGHHLTLIERDLDVPDHAVRLLLAPILTSVVRRKGRIFLVLPPRSHPRELWGMFSPVVSREEFVARVRIHSPVVPDADDGLDRVMLHHRPSDLPSEPRMPQALDFLREGADPEEPNLGVVWISALHALNAISPGSYTPDNLPTLARTYLDGAPVHLIYVGIADQPLTEALAPMAETRIRIVMRTGRAFVYGIEPWSPFLVLSEGDASRPLRLLLVV